MGNNALDVNGVVGPQADLAITTHGSDWYFAVCAIMGASTIGFLGMSLMRPVTHRMFHYLTASITFIACIAYFAMGSGLGQVPVPVEFPRPDSSMVGSAPTYDSTREMFYARYIDWTLTTPLLLLDLLLTAAVPWPVILITILADLFMIGTGLIAALTRTSYKWGFFTFGTAAFLFVVYQLVFTGRRHANAYGGAVSRTYNMCGVLLIGIWFLYPIAFGLSEGGNVIHPDSEAIFYGILDVIAKPVFGLLLILGHQKIDPAKLGLNVREPGPRNVRNGMHAKHGQVDNGFVGDTNNGHHSGAVPSSSAPGMSAPGNANTAV